MSDNESDPEIVQEEPEPAAETVTKPKKNGNLLPHVRPPLRRRIKSGARKPPKKKN